MKVIITGAPTRNVEHLRVALEEFDTPITEIVTSGHKSGLERMATEWAQKNNVPATAITCVNEHTRTAFTDRNRKMAEYADAMIVVGDKLPEHIVQLIRMMLASRKYVYEQSFGKIYQI